MPPSECEEGCRGGRKKKKTQRSAGVCVAGILQQTGWSGEASVCGGTNVGPQEKPLTSKAETLTPVAGTSQGADVEG